MKRKLSITQLRVLRELVKGKTDKGIADTLNFTPSGVNYHMQKLFLLFNVDNRTQLACTVIKEGLI